MTSAKCDQDQPRPELHCSPYHVSSRRSWTSSEGALGCMRRYSHARKVDGKWSSDSRQGRAATCSMSTAMCSWSQRRAPVMGASSTTFLEESRWDGVGNRHQVRPAVFQAGCGRVVCVHTGGTVHRPCYRISFRRLFRWSVAHSDRRLGPKLEPVVAKCAQNGRSNPPPTCGRGAGRGFICAVDLHSAPRATRTEARGCKRRGAGPGHQSHGATVPGLKSSVS
jgi:hypothetical protein